MIFVNEIQNGIEVWQIATGQKYGKVIATRNRPASIQELAEWIAEITGATSFLVNYANGQSIIVATS